MALGANSDDTRSIASETIISEWNTTRYMFFISLICSSVKPLRCNPIILTPV